MIVAFNIWGPRKGRCSPRENVFRKPECLQCVAIDMSGNGLTLFSLTESVAVRLKYLTGNRAVYVTN